jgi:hypothetical protein
MDRFDPDTLLRAGRSRTAQAAIGLVLFLYLAYHLTRFRLAGVWPIAPVGDASILYDNAIGIFQRVAYPDAIAFPYSPSAVVLFRALAAAGPTIFMLTWYALMVAGLIVSVRAALTQERAELRAAWPLIGIIAILLADSPIRWDLRNANSNLVYLGLVMAGYGLAGRRPLLAGTLVGLSISLKLYSGLLLAWLIVNGPRRMLYAGVAAMAVLWIALPLLLFSAEGTLQLYAGWKQQIEKIGDLSYQAYLATLPAGPPLTTLHRAVVTLTGESFQSGRTQALVWLLRGGWVALLAWYAWRCRDCLVAQVPSRAALADWTVLLLAPLPFSPWLEPYHAIPLLVAAVLCTAIAMDRETARFDRLLALAALATLALFLAAGVSFEVRGLALLAQFFGIAAILGLLRPRLARTSAQSGPLD